MNTDFFKRSLLLFLCFGLLSCAATQPEQIDDVCKIFQEKDDWYRKALRATENWGGSVSTIMAFMHKESSFRATAKPPRKKILWVFPGPRYSNAYGYSQALDSTWEWYKKSTGNSGADRDDFGDAADFIAWYNHLSHQRNHISSQNVYGLYLAYHEGHGGFAKKTYANKPRVKKRANRVALREQAYSRQLLGCEEELRKRRRFIFF